MNTRLLLALTISFSLTAFSAPTRAEPSTTNEYLAKFLEVHGWFCENRYIKLDNLKNDLKNDNRMSPSKEYEGVYEVMLNGASYAVTPEDDGCTTDVLLKKSGSANPIITLDEIDTKLVSAGYKRNSERKKYYAPGLDGEELKVTDVEYITTNNERAVLSYPLEKTDNYYMTLWVEKFASMPEN